jgi:hypothetical protein
MSPKQEKLAHPLFYLKYKKIKNGTNKSPTKTNIIYYTPCADYPPIRAAIGRSIPQTKLLQPHSVPYGEDSSQRGGNSTAYRNLI